MSNLPKTADAIRERWLAFFEARGHQVVPSASLIPHDPSLLFTAAGMVPFKPYMLGDEVPPFARATSVQKCFRTTDIERIGETARHLTFFEMLGNFSFGDYFREEAIKWAWELVTEDWGLDPELLWVTIFETDDDAEDVWRSSTGVDPAKIVRLGAADNFWTMGAAGPCGPCSEIYFDRGAKWGVEGGPAVDENRYVEIWNLVFMQSVMDEEGSIIGELPKKNIDTGAGLDRVAMVLQGAESVFEIDTTAPILETAQSKTSVAYGRNDSSDISLRVLTDHARAVAFLIADGVFPSNEDRGYVLRRILRRAVRHARLLGTDSEVVTPLVESAIGVFGSAYPELQKSHDFISKVTAREETRFGETLSAGLEMLERELAELQAGGRVPGAAAFKLHDTYGFPIDLTREVAGEAGFEVDDDAFAAAMEEQRVRAREATKAGRRSDDDVGAAIYREILDDFGPSRFIGYEKLSEDGRIVAIVRDHESVGEAREGDEVEVFVDVTPFYGEAGGQVGDTGSLAGETGRARVIDASRPIPDLVSHAVRVDEGSIALGQAVALAVDEERRDDIRRNHTATHLLHWALREVLGDHVKQAGSLVAPDRLRFDFSHFNAPTHAELVAVENLANQRVLANEPVTTFETTREQADELGATAFFGDKYGSIVRVVEAGDFSRELCGGTHVEALGSLGTVRIISEGSIGSNLRRIEALTGAASLAYTAARESALSRSAEMLRTTPDDLPEKLERLLADAKESEDAVRSLQRRLAESLAKSLADSGETIEIAGANILVAQLDEPGDMLREVAMAIRDRHSIDLVVLGSSIGKKGALVSAASESARRRGVSASAVISHAAKILGGGGGRGDELALAGGPKSDAIPEALAASLGAATTALGDEP